MDHYSVLGLAPGASVADVKRAYRRLSRRYHPGINPGDRAAESLFQRITEAYETLIDSERRRRYDAASGQPAPRTDTAFEFAGFDFSATVQGSQAATFSELFAESLHPVPQSDPARPEPGADLHASVVLSFEEAMRGAERQITVTRQVPCRVCRTSGRLRVAEQKCQQCHGTGRMRWARGHMVFTKACGACGGSGREEHRRCGACAGHGRVVRSDTIVVRIPAGVIDATRLRVPGQGHAGTHGGRSGDFYVGVAVQPHPVLRRVGDDLHLVLPVAVHEAVLGARIEVPSFDGAVRVRVPPGTQGGQRFRISGRGAVTAAGGRGDLYVEVRLVLPPVLDERSKELMREFARLHPEDLRRGIWQSAAARPTT